MPNIYIILDESGDLGFSQGSSGYFVMSAIVVKEEAFLKPLASKSSDKIRRFVINQLFKNRKNERESSLVFHRPLSDHALLSFA